MISPHEGIKRWGEEEWEAVPCAGEMGKTPERSLCGVRSMLKLVMAACDDYAKRAKSR